MKQLFISTLLLCGVLGSKAQTVPQTSKFTTRNIEQYGYVETTVKDTVKATFLISETKNGKPVAVPGYVVRTLWVYNGDRMLTVPPTDYSNQYKITGYLDTKKEPFDDNDIIWFDNKTK